MIDIHHAAITRDPKINWMCAAVQKHRELRGLTAAGEIFNSPKIEYIFSLFKPRLRSQIEFQPKTFRQELSRSWQGTQVQPDQGRQQVRLNSNYQTYCRYNFSFSCRRIIFPSQARQLAEEEQSEAEEEAIDCDLCPVLVSPCGRKYISRSELCLCITTRCYRI